MSLSSDSRRKLVLGRTKIRKSEISAATSARIAAQPTGTSGEMANRSGIDQQLTY
jgi:hypothetical protein